jgi:hypothetical protein
LLFFVVMAGHSRPKDGVAALAYARPSTSLMRCDFQDVDDRYKAGHDGSEIEAGMPAYFGHADYVTI